MKIQKVDPHDEPLLRAWHGVYERSQRHERAYAAPWRYEEYYVELAEPGLRRRVAAYAGLVGDDVVCTGALSTPILDNLTLASIEVNTDPSQRGRGFASAMLDHLEQAAAQAGRDVVTTEVSYPYDATSSPDLEFGTRRGYAVAIEDVMRVVDLPVDDALLHRQADAAAPHHTAYELLTVEGPLPEHTLNSYAALNAVLEMEAPLGELQREAMDPDPAPVREQERISRAQGRSWWTTLALHDGEVVAFTTIGSSDAEPELCFQWGTLVSREHRGHRLGLAVKVANLRAVQRDRPAARSVITWNAEVNTHMVGINEQLGFRPVERLAELQRRLPPSPTPPAAPAS